MDLGIDGRGYLITGGSAGLGLGLAKHLLAEGGRVAICGRDEARLAAATEELGGPSESVIALPADVRDPEALQRVLDTIGERWERLDGLVNNAGIHTSGRFETLTDEYWQADFELKLLAMIRGTRQALPLLRESDAPAVLNVLSIFARFQPNRSMPSSIYRAAGLAFTNAVSREVAADGVRVNAALIGFIHSDQWERAAADAGKPVEQYEAERAAELGIPLGRAGRTEEFADVATFLLSPRASYLTGTAVNIDGGMSLVP